MSDRNKQHHDRRMERLRLKRKKRNQRRALLAIEFAILGGLFFAAYQMEQEGRFEVIDITGDYEETVNNVENLDG